MPILNETEAYTVCWEIAFVLTLAKDYLQSYNYVRRSRYKGPKDLSTW